jgi:hypothetical protein
VYPSRRRVASKQTIASFGGGTTDTLLKVRHHSRMTLSLPDQIADKAIRFPESSYGANRVTLILADGRRVHEVFLTGGREIVKVGSRAVSHSDDLDFRITDIVDAVSEVR